jgi:hypothetical protein
VVRAWLKLLWNSAAVAAIAVAAQLGVADMLGIIRWQGGEPARTTDWNALLTWIGYSFAVAVVTGALAGRRAIQRPDRPDGIGSRIVATLLAAVGAGAGIGLAWLSAKDASAPVQVNPALVVAITAVAGVLVGVVISLIALSALPVAAGVRASIAWIWLVAIGCAVAGIVTHKPYPAPRLGVLDVPSLVAPSSWTGPRLMIVISAVIALVVAAIARWAGAGRFGIALVGFGGPAVVAAAYLIAGPGEGTDRAAQFDPYLTALLATAAGLIASVLIAMPGRRGATPKVRRRPAPIPDAGLPIFGDLISPEPPPMPASFGPSSLGSPPFGSQPQYAYQGTSYQDTAYQDTAYQDTAYQDTPAPEPLGRRSAAQPSMDYPTSEQPLVPQQPAYQSAAATYGGTTYGVRGTTELPADTLAPGQGGPGGQGPLIGQPGSADPHTSWLRELGSPGKHSAER